MATSSEYIEYVCEQVQGSFDIRYRKMFGEYMVYANDKPILLVCDNTVFVKKLPELEDLMNGADVGMPYDGSKEHYILDIDNKELVDSVVEVLERITPIPKSKKKK